MELDAFFSNWAGIVRNVVIGGLAYAGLVLLLRISGSRTLSKMNAFDLVVTVALGSTLSTILLDKEVALAEGVSAFAVLIGLQFIVSWSSVRSSTISGIVKAEPALLFYRGAFLEDRLRASRVVREEIMAAVRQQGITSMAEVEAVVLETDGSFSVVSPGESPETALAGLVGKPGTHRLHPE